MNESKISSTFESIGNILAMLWSLSTFRCMMYFFFGYLVLFLESKVAGWNNMATFLTLIPMTALAVASLVFTLKLMAHEGGGMGFGVFCMIGIMVTAALFWTVYYDIMSMPWSTWFNWFLSFW